MRVIVFKAKTVSLTGNVDSREVFSVPGDRELPPKQVRTFMRYLSFLQSKYVLQVYYILINNNIHNNKFQYLFKHLYHNCRYLLSRSENSSKNKLVVRRPIVSITMRIRLQLQLGRTANS